ncbi:pilus (MSHA type) biogenesis protein MshL [Gallaecimonas sp. GXIMD4217]|uniref:pilus (MSHA type) biogenesis protein MshL n=1 Tax=Gallaecimonas sp. GXIMD4217 TaxID=3131927 RepID=UPI00311AE850
MSNNKLYHGLLALLPALLLGCQSPQQARTRQEVGEIQASLSESLAEAKQPAKPQPLPPALARELLAPMAPPQDEPALARFDVSARDSDIGDLLGGLVADSPYSLVLHPQVSGKVTLNLRNVSLPEVLEVLEELYGFDIRTGGNMIRVFPAGMRTETFPVDYLVMKRQGLSLTSISSGRLSNNNGGGSSGNNSLNFSDVAGTSQLNQQLNNDINSGTRIESRSENDFWEGLEGLLWSLVGPGDGKAVIVNPQAGLVTVRANPAELRAVEDFLSQTVQQLQRQVILEAKIVEVVLDDDYQQGIDWQKAIFDGRTSTSLSLTTSAGLIGNSLSSALGGVSSLTFDNADFRSVITLLDTQGDVQVLSSPRITATNNQKAVIKVGTDEFFVTDISTTTVTGNATTTSPDIELTPFFSGIALDVTPQVSRDGSVTLHVHPSVIDVQEQTKVVSLDDSSFELPLAQSAIRESDTVVRARSGDVVVIGGLMKTHSRQQSSKTPLLGDIPLLGELFTSRRDLQQKTELVILLKPTVVGGQGWQQELQRSKDLLNRWYPDAGER